MPVASAVKVEPRPDTAAARFDAAAHAQAWRDADADSCAALLAVLRAGGDARLTLCGEHAAQTFLPARAGFLDKLKSGLGLRPAWNGWDAL